VILSAVAYRPVPRGDDRRRATEPMLAPKAAAFGNIHCGTQCQGNEMADLTMIGGVPVLRLVLELQPRGFPPSRCARTQVLSISSHAVFRQARSGETFPGEGFEGDGPSNSFMEVLYGRPTLESAPNAERSAGAICTGRLHASTHADLGAMSIPTQPEIVFGWRDVWLVRLVQERFDKGFELVKLERFSHEVGST